MARDSRDAERVADRLLDARRTLERDYALPLTVQRLARHARLPHLSFNRAYHDAFGIAPLDHLRLLRLQAAARLLVDGRAAADIAGGAMSRKAMTSSSSYTTSAGISRRMILWKMVSDMAGSSFLSFRA